MVEYAFQLSQTTIPSGQVTFVITNKGNEVHNFDTQRREGRCAARARSHPRPGRWRSLPGQYLYTCDVPFHAERGMTGLFTVTP